VSKTNFGAKFKKVKANAPALSPWSERVLNVPIATYNGTVLVLRGISHRQRLIKIIYQTDPKRACVHLYFEIGQREGELHSNWVSTTSLVGR
jgi:hypothetical protein